MHVATYLGLADAGEREYAEALREVSKRHESDAGVRDSTEKFARAADERRTDLGRAAATREVKEHAAPKRVRKALFAGRGRKPLSLLFDLHALAALALHLRCSWMALEKAAGPLHERALEDIARDAAEKIGAQVAWFETQIRHHAPQALVVAD